MTQPSRFLHAAAYGMNRKTATTGTRRPHGGGAPDGRCRRRGAAGGFTLVELIVTMAIVAILASIAVPSYIAYVARGNRADARAKLMDAASWMQRRFTEGNAYPTGALPTGLQQSPDTGTARYNLSLSAVNATSFTLQAAPTGTMATDECGTYTVDNFGAKGLQVGGSPVASNSALFARCWGR